MPDPYDVLTIAAIVDELSATIGSGRIQRIGLVDARTIGAEVYAGGRRHYLLASADDQLPRLRMAPTMPSLDPALVTPFGLLLRKYTRGGVILSVDQPPLERLVRFSIAKRHGPYTTPDDAPATLETPGQGVNEHDEDEPLAGDDDAGIVHVALYVELMGRRSNLILVDDTGTIMESAKRVTPAMSRVRTVLPRQPYTLPPPPDRLDPRAITEAEARILLTSLSPDANLAKAMVNTFRGISPLMAREITYRVSAAEDGPPEPPGPHLAAALVRETRALMLPLQDTRWSPRVYRERTGEGDDGGEAVASSPVPMAHLAATYDETRVDSISEAVAMAENAAQRPGPERHVQRRKRLLDAVGAARERVARRLTALEGEANRAAEAERLRNAGELIYAYLWQIEPGQAELAVDGETIALDPLLSASENAQAYFERYRKAQSAEVQLPHLAEEARTELSYLDQLVVFIEQAPGFAELEALAAEWAERIAPDPGARPRRKRAPRRPQALVDAAGNSVYVGRSGPQNDLLTFELAGPDDTWLHARGVGGSHVIIRWRDPGAPENSQTIEAAAALAAWYSAARGSGGVEVDVARRRHVRKIKGAGPGMVTYRNERTIRVQPAPEEALHDVLRQR